MHTELSEDCQEASSTFINTYSTRLGAQELQYLHQGSGSLGTLPVNVEERLALLTRIAEILGLDDLRYSSYSAAIACLSSQELFLRRSSAQLENVENQLRTHLALAQHEENLIIKWGRKIETDQNHENATTIERRKERLVKKAREYQKELDALMVDMVDPPVTITELASQHDHVRKREADIKAKRAKIQAFQGLPPNLGLARTELKRARDEQTELVKLRERILGKMAEGVT